jgi:hypothetical protein
VPERVAHRAVPPKVFPDRVTRHDLHNINCDKTKGRLTLGWTQTLADSEFERIARLFEVLAAARSGARGRENFNRGVESQHDITINFLAQID